ncbi:MAG: universal stress protein [Candidatus Limnocylindria bacterium]
MGAGQLRRTVLCAVGPRDTGRLVELAVTMFGAERCVLHMVFAAHDGAPQELIGLRGSLGRGPRRGSERLEQVENAVRRTGDEVLAEAAEAAQRAGLGAQRHLVRGRPEREIVDLAAKLQADLLVVGAREGEYGPSEAGPRSVGHVARFVIDHAPCPVLVVRGRGRPGGSLGPPSASSATQRL